MIQSWSTIGTANLMSETYMEDQNYFPSVEFLGFIFDFWHIEEYILHILQFYGESKLIGD